MSRIKNELFRVLNVTVVVSPTKDKLFLESVQRRVTLLEMALQLRIAVPVPYFAELVKRWVRLGG